MIEMGLTNRGETICTLLGAWFSAFPDTAIITLVAQQRIREYERVETDALKEHFASRAKMYGS